MKNRIVLILLAVVVGSLFILATLGLSANLVKLWEGLPLAKQVIGVLGVGAFVIFSFVMFQIAMDETEVLIRRR